MRDARSFIGSGEIERPPGLSKMQCLGSFDAFYDTEFESVAALALVLSGSRHGAEDLAQEAFLAAYRRWDEIGLYDDPGAWVRRVVANRAVSVIRRRVVEAKALPRLIRAPDPLPDMSPESEHVWRAVRRLPRRQAQTVALFYLEDLPLDQIASILDLSVETVRTHLRRARKTLNRRLAVEEAIHEP
ncbi:MAG: SigE family RNA polymerase sigma factor [bacterium]|nr:SigE family RNA polymerase sigma factor [bacterium]